MTKRTNLTAEDQRVLKMIFDELVDHLSQRFTELENRVAVLERELYISRRIKNGGELDSLKPDPLTLGGK